MAVLGEEFPERRYEYRNYVARKMVLDSDLDLVLLMTFFFDEGFFLDLYFTIMKYTYIRVIKSSPTAETEKSSIKFLKVSVA